MWVHWLSVIGGSFGGIAEAGPGDFRALPTADVLKPRYPSLSKVSCVRRAAPSASSAPGPMAWLHQCIGSLPRSQVLAGPRVQ